MRVAVAGGTGFLGRHVAARLAADGHDVVVLARSAAPALAGAPRVTAVQVDAAGDASGVAAALAGCDALVNLVGVKRASAAQGFERAHVTAVTALVAGCVAAGVARLVHVSVVDGAANDEYRATKRRGEAIVAASGLAWTIVRPGVIAGAGDDFLTNLAAMIRQAALFPAPGGGSAEIQPVLADDVAAAIAAVLARPAAAGRCYDVVGPERLPLRAWVSRISAAMELRTWIVPAPGALLAPIVAAMERVLPAPPLTRAQLAMLRGGMIGDPEPARAELGLATTALTTERIAALTERVPPWLGVSLRVAPAAGHRAWLRGCAPALPRVAALVPLAALLIAGLRAATPDIWRCMLAANLLLIPAALTLPLPWRELLRPRLRDLAFGAAGAAALYALGWLGAAGLRVVAPALIAQSTQLYAWADVLSPAAALPLLAVIVAGEELFWRAAIALPAAGRWGPWAGVLASSLAFTAAHLAVGPPVLWLAAAVYGAAWAWLVVRTRSWWPGFVCHYLWDVAVLFVAPY